MRVFEARVDGDLDKELVDLFVAVFTGGLQIICIDRGFRIVGLVDVMNQTRGVATDAVGGFFRSQGGHFAVYGFLVGYNSLYCFFRSIQLLHQLFIAMAVYGTQ